NRGVQHRLPGLPRRDDPPGPAMRGVLPAGHDLPAGRAHRRSGPRVRVHRGRMGLRMTSPPDHQREAISRAAVRTRRRVMISCGMTLLVALVATAGVLGAGCFDEGSYEGGGRRIGAPIQTSEEEAP